MNRSESKYYSTAARMNEAFLELLEKKDFAYITVKEICEKAGVNRSTFYLHYETINDLLEESAQHIIDQFVGLSQILCKRRNAVQIEQNLFKAEVAQAAAALFSK